MSSRRTLILIGAIAIGAFAAIALLNYVRGVEDSVYEDRQPVEVLVAAQDIPAGTSAEAAMTLLEVREIPLDMRPTTFLEPGQTEVITGLIALNNIPKNQIIVGGMFVDGTVVQQSFRDRIPSGMVAISIPIGNVQAVAGWVQPGDEVNLMVVKKPLIYGDDPCVPPPTEDSETGDAAEDAPPPPPSSYLEDAELEGVLIYCTYDKAARYVFQRLEILAVGDRTQLQPGETVDPNAGVSPSGGIITFMVPNREAQLLASITHGDIWLTLLPEDYEAEPLSQLTYEELYIDPTHAENPAQLTPYGPDGFIAGDESDDPVAIEPADGAETTDDESTEG